MLADMNLIRPIDQGAPATQVRSRDKNRRSTKKVQPRRQGGQAQDRGQETRDQGREEQNSGPALNTYA